MDFELEDEKHYFNNIKQFNRNFAATVASFDILMKDQKIIKQIHS
jgi:hypothetical protein